MTPELREEQAALYALGALDAAEIADLERAIKADASLARLVEEFRDAAGLLAQDVPPVAPPARLRAAVMDAIRSEKPVTEAAESRANALGWIPWAIAAALALACVQFFSERTRLTERLTQAGLDYAELLQRTELLQAQLRSLETEREELKTRVASLEGADPLAGVRAVRLAAQPGIAADSEVIALWDPRRQSGTLDLSKLPKAGADQDYQLWIVTPEADQPLDAGVVAAGGTRSDFKSPRAVAKVAALAISLEPKGGSAVRRGPIVYLGTL